MQIWAETDAKILGFLASYHGTKVMHSKMIFRDVTFVTLYLYQKRFDLKK